MVSEAQEAKCTEPPAPRRSLSLLWCGYVCWPQSHLVKCGAELSSLATAVQCAQQIDFCGLSPRAEGDPPLGTLTVLVHSRGANPLTLFLLTDWATDRKLMRAR